jgi:hypothetical protein
MKLSDLKPLVDVDRTQGFVYPEQPLAPLPHKGARGYALERYRDFLARLVFQREVNAQTIQAFQIPPERIFIHYPEQSRENPNVTGIAFIPGPYTYDEKWMYALGRPDADEDTADKYAPGTVVTTMGYYVETITVEAVTSSYAMTRGIIEGIRYATRLFTDCGILYLNCPDYFDQVAAYSIVGGDGYSVDLATDAAGRRIAHLQVEVWIPEVALVNYRPLRVLLDLGPGESRVRDGNVYPTIE